MIIIEDMVHTVRASQLCGQSVAAQAQVHSGLLSAANAVMLLYFKRPNKEPLKVSEKNTMPINSIPSSVFLSAAH